MTNTPERGEALTLEQLRAWLDDWRNYLVDVYGDVSSSNVVTVIIDHIDNGALPPIAPEQESQP